MPREAERRGAPLGPIPLWFVLGVGASLACHVLAGIATDATIDLMRSSTPFARDVRAMELRLIPNYAGVAYVLVTAVLVVYLWPLVVYFRRGLPRPVPASIQRRAVSFPLVGALGGLAPWLFSLLFFPAATVLHFGTWRPDLMSQQILSPLMNGFLAATTCYLVVDWIFRTTVIPKLLADGGSIERARGVIALGVRGRLLIFLTAVAFVPLFTMLGLVYAARERFAAGHPAGEVIAGLVEGGDGVFWIYLLLGLFLTLIIARTLTRPLAATADALDQVRRGRLDVAVPVDAADEIGKLEEGVNQMVRTLRDNQRILDAFGRVVDPTVRDRLLRGELGEKGSQRRATVMFCDLRGFTGMAEREAPEEIVNTLNRYFALVSQWARDCGGFVDKFIGDAVLVVFGLFEPEGGEGGPANDAGAEAALRCAVGLRRHLLALNQDREHSGLAVLRTATALHTGNLVAGLIGGAERHEYTVIGDTVNVAARLAELAKQREHDLVVSAETLDLAGRAGKDAIAAFRETVFLRGRREPIEMVGID